jgi:type IV pilus assembly protein PilM
MLDRLNQPISFRRRRPENEDTAKEQAPAAPAADATEAPSAAPARAAAATPGPASPRLPRGRRRSATLVGLEIEPGQIVAAKSHVNGRVVVEHAVGTPIAPNLVRDGEVTDVDGLSTALADLFDGSGLDRRVRIGIANQRIVMRQIELPPILDPKELETAVRFQAQDEIPMPIESVVLDYHPLGVTETEAGARMRVLLVAARRDMVERVLLAARQAGLRPEAVDLAAFGMIRALRPADVAEGERVLDLSVGGLTNLAIASGSTCEFTRAITTGIDQIVSEVASRCGMPFADARRVIASVSGTASVAQPTTMTDGGIAVPASALSVAGESADDHAEIARIALGDGIRRIAAEIRNSLDFHLGSRGQGPVARAILTGPALDLNGFDVALGREIGLPLVRAEVELAAPDANGHVPMSRLAVAAGLSVEEGPK